MAAVARAELPAVELDHAPTAARIAALQAEAARAGWPAVARELRQAAVGLYARNGAEAQSWYYLFRWAELFGCSDADAVNTWIAAVNHARAGHPGMANRYAVSPQPLAGFWPADLQAYAMGARDWSDQFFTLVSPLDNPPQVMEILAALWARNPAEFRTYANLALAIAVVYDVPPPPTWPHGQVSTEALPRRLPPPAEIFAFFIHADQAGATLEPLRRLPAADLKFVVDTPASFGELTWAEQDVRTPLALLAKVYDSVRYRRDRIANNVMIWPGPRYALPDILRSGGICVDQAYFAATVGKAKGVPTLLFQGAGLDGRHAWFGYLGGDGRWQLDCGRYPEQRYVIGLALDPQTWTVISDHELAFLSEGFRRLPLYRSSLVHSQFADLYFASGDFAAAARAARNAVNIEPRNLDGWNILLAARRRQDAGPRQLEAVMQEAARAFQRYPDVEAGFRTLFVQSLRARGETSLADQIERGTAQKYVATREDISVKQAQDMLDRSLAQGSLDDSVRTYYRVLDAYGRGGGINFFDRIVQPFVNRLLEQDRPAEAVQALTQARRFLHVEPQSQLEGEINLLDERVRRAVH